MFAVHKVQCALRFKRPHHADFVDIQPDAFGGSGIDAEQAQCLHQVQVCFACRNNAEASCGQVKNLAIDRIGRGKRERRRFLRVEPLFYIKAG